MFIVLPNVQSRNKQIRQNNQVPNNVSTGGRNSPILDTCFASNFDTPSDRLGKGWYCTLVLKTQIDLRQELKIICFERDPPRKLIGELA